MNRRIAIDFYRVLLPQPSQTSFGEVLEQAASVPLPNRNVSKNGDFLRLQVAVKHGAFWEGDIIRIKMDQLPLKAGLDGELSAIDFEKDEGLGEACAFLYHMPSSVLAIQRNRSAVTASSFAYYFAHQPHGATIQLDVILEEAIIKKLDRLAVVRAFDVKVAALDHVSLLKKQDRSVEGIVNISQYFQAPHIRVSVTMGRQKGRCSSLTRTEIAVS